MKYKVALYARVSTEEQAKKGYSIESQIDILNEYCEENNLTVVEVYKDMGVSGSKFNRPELQRLLKDVKDKKINYILFTRLDRWFRSVSQYYKTQDILDANKAVWKCVNEDYETLTSTGKFKVNIMLSVAQQFRDATGEKIKEVFAQRIPKGQYNSGSCPYGFKVVQDNGARVVKDKEAAPVIEDAIKQYQLNNSLRKTYLYLKDNYDFERSYITFRRIMINDLLHGEYKGNKNFCEGYLTEKEHNAIKNIIANKNVKSAPHRKTYIFSSLCICPHCGHKMIGTTNSKGLKYYRCSTARINKSCDFNLAISDAKLESYMIDHIAKELKDHVIEIELENNKKSKPKQNLDKLKRELDRLNELYVLDRLDSKKYEKMYNDTLAKIQAHSETKTVDTSKYRELLKVDITGFYATLNEEEKRVFWRNIIEHIEFTEDRKPIIFLK